MVRIALGGVIQIQSDVQAISVLESPVVGRGPGGRLAVRICRRGCRCLVVDQNDVARRIDVELKRENRVVVLLVVDHLQNLTGKIRRKSPNQEGEIRQIGRNLGIGSRNQTPLSLRNGRKSLGGRLLAQLLASRGNEKERR